MSGGSLNHLQYQQQPSALDLQAAIGALERLITDGPDAGGELGPLLAARGHTMRILDAIPAEDDPIRDVWRALDLHGSGDVGVDAVIAALRAYHERIDGAPR